jgi:hypothetical protein
VEAVTKPLRAFRSLSNRLLHSPPRENHPPFIIKDEFLPKGDFVALQRWAFSVHCGLTRKNMNWIEVLVGDFAEVKISDPFITQEPIPDELDRFAKALREFDRIGEELDLFFQVYRWTPRSGIGLHGRVRKNVDLVRERHLGSQLGRRSHLLRDRQGVRVGARPLPQADDESTRAEQLEGGPQGCVQFLDRSRTHLNPGLHLPAWDLPDLPAYVPACSPGPGYGRRLVASAATSSKARTDERPTCVLSLSWDNVARLDCAVVIVGRG